MTGFEEKMNRKVCSRGSLIEGKQRRWTDITPGHFLSFVLCFVSLLPVIVVVALAAGMSAVKWAGVKQPTARSHRTTTTPLLPCHVLCFLVGLRVLL